MRIQVLCSSFLLLYMCVIRKEERELQKFYQRGYIVILGDLCNAIKQCSDKISLQHADEYELSVLSKTCPKTRF